MKAAERKSKRSGEQTLPKEKEKLALEKEQDMKPSGRS